MIGAFLVGMLVGAFGVFLLTGLALWFLDVRRAVREGTPLVGEALERNRLRQMRDDRGGL